MPIDSTLLAGETSGRWGVIGITEVAGDQDEFSVNLSNHGGQVLDIVLTGFERQDYEGQTLELLAPDGTTVATGSATPLPGDANATNLDLGIFGFEVPESVPGDGVYSLRMEAPFNDVAYSLIVTSGATFDAEPNNNPAGDPLRNITDTRFVIGHLDATTDADDHFLINVDAGQTATFSTRFAFDPALSPINTLDTELEIFDAAGNSLAVDMNSGEGGHASVAFAATAAGTYTVRVGATSGVGEYLFEAVVDEPPGGHFTDSGQMLFNDIRDVAVVDVDGDGDPDVFTANGFESDRILLNDGTGTLTDSGQLLSHPAGGVSTSVAIGDLNGDGHPDAFVSLTAAPEIAFLNDGAGVFTSTGQTIPPPSNAFAFSTAVLGDVDGDGDLDAVVAQGASGVAGQVLLNNGDGLFTDSGNSFGNNLWVVSLGDVDGDGDLDAMTATSGNAANKVWLNDGSGVFTDSGQSLGNGDAAAIELADLDGDGDIDAFVANSLGTFALGNANKVWLNNGSGVFTDSGQNLGTGHSQDVALSDLNGDGALDAFVVNDTSIGSDPANVVWLNDGNGNFTASGQLLGDNRSVAVALGDLNGDAYIDAVVANVGSGAVWFNGPAGVLPTNTTPIVDAGGPYAIDVGTDLTLDATQSSDADSDSLTFRWDIDGDGDFDEDITGVQPTLTWAEMLALGLPDGPSTRQITVEAGDGTDVDTAVATLTVQRLPGVFVDQVGGVVEVSVGGSIASELSLTIDSGMSPAELVIRDDTNVLTTTIGTGDRTHEVRIPVTAAGSGTSVSLTVTGNHDDSVTVDGTNPLEFGDGNVNLSAGKIVVSNGIATGGNIVLLATNGIEFSPSSAQTIGSSSLTFNADSDANGTGNFVQNANASIHSSGGSVSISAVDVELQGTIAVGVGSVTFAPSKAAADVFLGGSSSGEFVLSDSELNRVTSASMITIGSATTGNVELRENVSLSMVDRLEIVTAGTIAASGSQWTLSVPGAVLNAGNGVGSASVPLATAIDRLEADGGSGGVFVSNAGDLTIGDVSSAIAGVVTSAGDIAIAADGSLTVNEAVVNSGGGDVELISQASRSFGQLTFLESERDNAAGVDGLDRATEAAISPDGQHLYVTAHFDDAVSVFSRDAATGELTFVEVLRNNVGGVSGLQTAQGVIVSPDGLHVYVTGNHSVAAFSRNMTNGTLTFVEVLHDDVSGIDGLLGADRMAFSPDGRDLYLTSQVDDAVAVFRRNAADGRLTFIEWHPGLDGAQGVAVSSDGQHVYVAVHHEDSVRLYNRNATDGTLTFVESQVDGVGGVDGLDGTYGLRISPDGRNVYVVGYVDNAVSVFDRDPTNGLLTFVESHHHAVAGVTGLDGPTFFDISPDGQNVYVAGQNSDSAAVFLRDPVTGRLTFVEDQTNGANGVTHLDGAGGVVTSPDSRHVYLTAYIDDAIVAFSRDDVGGTEDPGLFVNANVSATGSGSVVLNAQADIRHVAGLLIASGTGTVDISANNQSLAGRFDSSGGLTSVLGDVRLRNETVFSVDIGGNSVGPGVGHYAQLSATGSLTIDANVSLQLLATDDGSGSDYVPQAGDTFTLIRRSGGSGTFAGLPEGTVISNLLGSGIDATLTYAGGDGDDIVLQLEAAPAPTVDFESFPAGEVASDFLSDFGITSVSVSAGVPLTVLNEQSGGDAQNPGFGRYLGQSNPSPWSALTMTFEFAPGLKTFGFRRIGGSGFTSAPNWTATALNE
ncbi:MAG: VCBS repeat-containing protein, partial [Planctomycetaceae bacterium]|nr:VCBS repeat-containing protein [Planctomycetaceae bacterium]